MLGAISHQRTGMDEKVSFDSKLPDGTIQTSNKSKAEDDDNDMSWLYGSMG